MASEPGDRHDVRAHQPEAVSDWLYPFSLGTMSASAYIARHELRGIASQFAMQNLRFAM